MFPWTKQARRLAEQQEAIAALRKRCLALEEAGKSNKELWEKQVSELRAACVQEPSFRWYEMRSLPMGSGAPAKPYTAMDAVRLLLDKSGLTIDTERGKSAQHKLVPVKKAAKKRR